MRKSIIEVKSDDDSGIDSFRRNQSDSDESLRSESTESSDEQDIKESVTQLRKLSSARASQSKRQNKEKDKSKKGENKSSDFFDRLFKTIGDETETSHAGTIIVQETDDITPEIPPTADAFSSTEFITSSESARTKKYVPKGNNKTSEFNIMPMKDKTSKKTNILSNFNVISLDITTKKPSDPIKEALKPVQKQNQPEQPRPLTNQEKLKQFIARSKAHEAIIEGTTKNDDPPPPPIPEKKVTKPITKIKPPIKKQPSPKIVINEKRLDSIFEIPTSDSNEPFTKDNIVLDDASQAEPREMYLFDIHEEGKNLYLFCKYNADPTQYGTICLCIPILSYTLHFKPGFDTTGPQLEHEISKIAIACGGELISSKWVEKKMFNHSTQNWLEAELSTNCDIAKVPIKSNNFEKVSGATASLTEQFCNKYNIKGPRWIRVHCAQSLQQQTTIPMFINQSNGKIEISNQNTSKPPFNLCIFSIYSNSKKEIFMVSLRLLNQWDVDKCCEYANLRGAKQSIVTIIVGPKVSGSTDIFCQNEKELLLQMIDKIDKSDVDILVSYDLLDADFPLLINRMKSLNIKDWDKLGRHFRTNFTTNINFLTSGRVLCDLKFCYRQYFGIETNSLASLVRQVFNIDLPVLDVDKLFEAMSNRQTQNNLKAMNRSDTKYMKQLLDHKKIIPVAQMISRITGCCFSSIMSQPSDIFIESFLVSSFTKDNFIIPDRKINQESISSKFSIFDNHFGFFENDIHLYSCKYFIQKIIREKHICFTSGTKKNQTILPQIINQLFNTKAKVKTSEDTENIKPTTKAITIILQSFITYLFSKNARFPVSNLISVLEEELRKTFGEFGKEILWFNDGKLLLKTSDPDATFQRYDKRHKYATFDLAAKLKRVLIISDEVFVGSLTDSDKLLAYNYECFRHDWCEITKDIVNHALIYALRSDDPDEEILDYISKYKSKIDNDANIGNFSISSLIPKYMDEESDFAKFIHSERVQSSLTALDDRIEYVVCKSGYKLKKDVKVTNEIDFNWYIQNQICPALIKILQPFYFIKAQQIKDSLDIINQDTLNIGSDFIAEMAFFCPNCDQINYFADLAKLNCTNCGIKLKWKSISNKLTKFIRDFIYQSSASRFCCDGYLCNYETHQLPTTDSVLGHTDPFDPQALCKGKLKHKANPIDVFETLNHFQSLFSKNDDPEMAKLNEYMLSVLNPIINYQNLQNINFSEVFSQHSSFESQTNDDVCSFVDL